jgi:hypothetical protein
MIQDGTELWNEKTRQKAVYALITAARVLNGSYIREDDIEFFKQENIIQQSQNQISESDLKLLESIRSGAKVVLNHDDLRVKMRITSEECKLIQRIREGMKYGT